MNEKTLAEQTIDRMIPNEKVVDIIDAAFVLLDSDQRKISENLNKKWYKVIPVLIALSILGAIISLGILALAPIAAGLASSALIGLAASTLSATIFSKMHSNRKEKRDRELFPRLGQITNQRDSLRQLKEYLTVNNEGMVISAMQEDYYESKIIMLKDQILKRENGSDTRTLTEFVRKTLDMMYKAELGKTIAYNRGVLLNQTENPNVLNRLAALSKETWAKLFGQPLSLERGSLTTSMQSEPRFERTMRGKTAIAYVPGNDGYEVDSHRQRR